MNGTSGLLRDSAERLFTAVDLVRIAAFHAAPTPLAETMLGGWLFARAGYHRAVVASQRVYH
jgi:hypothetical protein